MQEIVTRKDAVLNNLKLYYTGAPCNKGHLSQRYVKNHSCLECKRLEILSRPKKEKRSCCIESCNNKIMSLNKTGYCKVHRDLSPQRKEWAKNYSKSEKAVNKRKENWKNKSEEKHEYFKKINSKSSRLWREKNKEIKKKINKKWIENNREKYEKKQKDWINKNPEKVKAYRSVCKNRRRSAEGKYTGKQILNLLSLQKNKCITCKVNIKENYHVDHIMPLALGGDNFIANIQLLCPKCNVRKNAKHPIDWMQQNGFLL